MRVEIAQLTESGVAMVDRWDEECKAHARTRHERDALREEVARLNRTVEAVQLARFQVEDKLGQAVAALRDAVKHCRQCNGIGEYWPHCDACADSTCDHECPPRQLCGVCAEWRAILADADSATAGDYVRELEAIATSLKKWRDEMDTAAVGPASVDAWMVREIDARFPRLAAVDARRAGEKEGAK